MTLNVGGRVKEFATGRMKAGFMFFDVEDFGRPFHHVRKGQIIVVNRIPSIPRTVNNRPVIDGQHRHCDQSKSFFCVILLHSKRERERERGNQTAIVDEGHEREMKTRNLAVKVRLKAFEFVSSHLGRGGVVIAVETLCIERKLEQDLMHLIFRSSRHSSCLSVILRLFPPSTSKEKGKGERRNTNQVRRV